MDKEVIIVTGACGRIGSAVVKRLGSDYRVVGFELLKAIYAADNEELVPVDLTSDESVAQAFNHIKANYGTKIASVIHLAAYYSFDQQHSPLYDKVTVGGTERLLKALQGFEVGQFIFSSTMLVYKPCQPGQKINEEWPVEPRWDYPLSKVKTEKLIHDLRGKMPVVIFRIAGVYDDRCHSIPISHQIQRIYEKDLEAHLFAGNTHHGAAFVHMDDLVDAIVAAVSKRKQLPQDITLIIGEDHTLSYDDLQKEISKLLWGKEIKTMSIPKWLAYFGAWIESHIPLKEKPFIKPWMIPLADDHYELDTGLAAKELGWKPQRSLENTLPKMIEALKADPEKFYKDNQLKKGQA